ncbi:hypothetical protein [Streptomyces sp. NPDC058092]|uniref:hypothetical protein n=1 Tax=Streptomyces sp. NPDC058092 TaxID=3346336 RepID=UPI0036E1F19A
MQLLLFIRAFSDDRVTNVICDATTLPPGAFTPCHGTYTITQADANACKKTKSGGDSKLCPVTNVAVAAGTGPQGNQIASTPAEVTIKISKKRPKPPHHKPPHKKPVHKKPVHHKPSHKKPVHKRTYSEEGSNGQGQA